MFSFFDTSLMVLSRVKGHHLVIFVFRQHYCSHSSCGPLSPLIVNLCIMHWHNLLALWTAAFSDIWLVCFHDLNLAGWASELSMDGVHLAPWAVYAF